MGHHALQVELERGADRDQGKALLQRLEHLEVVAHHHVGFAGEQELHAVHLGTAHLDGDVEPGLLVEAGRLRLVEPAMLGLGEPARQEGHLVGGGRCAGRSEETGKRREDEAEPGSAATGDFVGMGHLRDLFTPDFATP